MVGLLHWTIQRQPSIVDAYRREDCMEIIQWVVAAGTAMFVATVGYYQWRTAEQKAALDLFERRHEIYQVVVDSVGQMVRNSSGFDAQHERDLLSAMGRAYFFFGDD